ncbi:hypothetical protein OOK48_35425 [Streptomyces viridodiastaticus]|uniref:hypothetical protein n=1 Tax=Streptomyces albogriseolus TaxID=1887 RepID=UPI0022590701|nr:hypothetical protein [Streptomyces viridodiastaticus]MCX4571613.1 hypothetical protein [Streptomyces viridodiastaticus]
MTQQGEEAAVISHVGPVPNVSVHAHMRSGPHAVTTDPLDLLVVVELMFLFGEQARRRASDEPLVITPQSVLERLREMGVRSGNGSRLVGRDAVYASFGRLREKGYIRRIVLSDAATGQRTGVAYEFYDWPAWNPDAPAVVEFSQVGATSGIAGSGDAGSSAGNRTKTGSVQVGATSGNAGSGDAGSSESSQVTPTSGNAGSPPHPPEEVETSSPYPLTHTTRGVPSQKEEGEVEFDTDDVRAAENFLQRMQKPWNAGRSTARKCAPRLLAVMRDQGWPAIGELSDTDRRLLEAEITKNPGGVTSYAHVLPKRIADLPLYDIAAKPGPGSSPRKPLEGMCLRHEGFREDDCAPCKLAERERASRGRSEPRGLTGDAAALLARLKGAQPAQGD